MSSAVGDNDMGCGAKSGPASSIRSLTQKITQLEAKVCSLDSQVQLLKKQLQRNAGTVINLDTIRTLLLQINQEQANENSKSKLETKSINPNVPRVTRTRFSTIRNPIICDSIPRLRPRSSKSKPQGKEKEDPEIEPDGGSSDEQGLRSDLDDEDFRPEDIDNENQNSAHLHDLKSKSTPINSPRKRKGPVNTKNCQSDEEQYDGVEPKVEISFDEVVVTKKPKTTQAETSEPSLPNKFDFCEECDKWFDTPYKFKRHMVTRHSSVKSFKCPICNKLFKLRYHVTRHVHNVHKYKEFTSEMVEPNDLDSS